MAIRIKKELSHSLLVCTYVHLFSRVCAEAIILLYRLQTKTDSFSLQLSKKNLFQEECSVYAVYSWRRVFCWVRAAWHLISSSRCMKRTTMLHVQHWAHWALCNNDHHFQLSVGFWASHSVWEVSAQSVCSSHFCKSANKTVAWPPYTIPPSHSTPLLSYTLLLYLWVIHRIQCSRSNQSGAARTFSLSAVKFNE